jgi:hypothetical protein
MSKLEGQYGVNGRAGQVGENFYDRALGTSTLSDFYEVHRSLRIPTPAGRQAMNGDVDCALANGNSLVLVDVKKWKTAGSLWTAPDGALMHGETRDENGALVHEFRAEKMPSKNMQIALERYSAFLPQARVSAMVAFVPTDRAAESEIDVHRFIWPGDIRSYAANDSYTEIVQRLGKQRPVSAEISALLISMTN